MASSTLFKNFSTPVEDRSLLLIIKDIIEGKYKDRVEEVRICKVQGKDDQADKFKRELPAFTPSGKFEGGRKMEYFKMYSGFVHLDFDKLTEEELVETKKTISECLFTFACFTSPSGNGVKVFIEVNTGVELHEQAYKEVQAYYENLLGIEADPKCKDITRLCFVSYDPDGFKNIQNKKFEVSVKAKVDENKPYPKEEIKVSNPIGGNIIFERIFSECVTFTDQKQTYAKGNRNNYLYQLACNCNRRGIPCEEALSFISTRYDLNQKEIHNAVNSAYHHQEQQHGSYAKLNQNTIAKPTLSNEDYLKQTPTIDEGLYPCLPDVLRLGSEAFTAAREKDVFFTGALAILSGCLPNVKGEYAGNTVFPNLYCFVVAPAANGKGVMKFSKQLANQYQDHLLEINKQEKTRYEGELSQYKALQRDRKKGEIVDVEEPQKAPFQVCFIPGNCSSAKVIDHLSNNEGKGIICETEADSLGNVFKQDWGGYSEMLRNGFHHETISFSRKTDNEYILIKEPKLSVTLSGIPGQVANIISSAEDGLFSRFLFYSFKVDQIWKDVSPFGNPINLNDHFKMLSQQVFNLVKFSIEHPLEVKLTKGQWQQLNLYGSKCLQEITTFTAEEAGSVAKRMMLILYRITMIFTALRRFENGDCTEQLACTKEDFEMALHIAGVYLEHSTLMYNNLPQKEERGPFKGGNNKKLFYDALPQSFQRKEAITLGIAYGMKERSIDNLLKSLIDKYLTQPVYGRYEKV